MQIVIVKITPRPISVKKRIYGAFLCSIKLIKKGDMVVVSRKQGIYYAIGEIVEIDEEGKKISST